MAEWVRVDVDFLRHPDVLALEEQNSLWPIWWLDLIFVAREADAKGRLVYDEVKPWRAEQLAKRRGANVDDYRAFLGKAFELGLIKNTTDGDMRLSDWRHLLDVRPKTDAERQAARRARLREAKSNEDEIDDECDEEPETPVTCHDMSRDVTKSHEESRRVTKCHPYMTEQTEPDKSLQTQRSQTDPDLGSPDAQKAISDFGEQQFWNAISRAYETTVKKAWQPADARKISGCLEQPWAKERPCWIVRYYAIWQGLEHMAAKQKERQETGRGEEIKSPLGYALSMAHKYAPSAEEHVTSNAQRVANGHPKVKLKFKLLDQMEDCFGPDYEMRGEPEPELALAG